MVSQIAVTLLILVAAGLFLRTLSNLASIQLGFNRENVLTFQLNARQAGHNDPEIVAFYNDLRTQFSAIPGVRARKSLESFPDRNGHQRNGGQRFRRRPQEQQRF